MDKRTEARETIDRVDREMANLFAERMAAAQQIAAYKKEHALPIEDKAREDAMLARETEYVTPALRPYYRAFLSALIAESKRYQAALIGELDPRITVKTGALREVGAHFDLSRRTLVVTDDGVPPAYAKAVCDAAHDAHLFVLPQGEASKNRESYFAILRELLALSFTRRDCVVAVGGGVVCDLAGFAAATYMRGIDYYAVPTTLLAQVDASVGGKNGIDFDGVKNVVGTFNEPKAVLVDPSVLTTLDRRQYACGMAEVIKMAATCDAALFKRLEKEANPPIEEVIRAALAVKTAVVREDFAESGRRRVLNFGHTVGHALELNTDLLHGEAVGVGMLAMTDGAVRRRVAALLARYGLPTHAVCDAERLAAAIRHDKKSTEDAVVCVTVPEIGSYQFVTMTVEEILDKSREVNGR